MVVSDQQPYLFGYAGYWEKLRQSQVHICIADVDYRPEDKLHRFVRPDGATFQPVMLVDKNDRRTCNVRIGQTKAFKRSLEQSLLTKQCEFAWRFEGFIQSIEEGMLYLDLWKSMYVVMAGAIGINAELIIATERPVGDNTFARNVDRLRRYYPHSITRYLCGPYVTEYYDPEVPFDTSVMEVSTADEPSPVSTAWWVARQPEVHLGTYTTSYPFRGAE